jgi:hypothetical protein
LLPLMILVCHKMLQKTAQRIQDNLEITSLQDDRFHSRFINPKLPCFFQFRRCYTLVSLIGTAKGDLILYDDRPCLHT